uniref:Uncharacterized protein n=1 Tax=viral metagenome TaxID=1070528 RepID=A0A6C0K343_9ZZZZ
MKKGHGTIIEAYNTKAFTLMEAKKTEETTQKCPKGWALPPPPSSSSLDNYCCPQSSKAEGKHYNLIKVNDKPYCFPHKHPY